MSAQPDVINKLAYLDPYFSAVDEFVKGIIRKYCDDHGFAFLPRKKTANSLAEKIETGRFKTWSEIDDILAYSIVVPTLNLEDSVIDFLRAEFEEKLLKKRGSTQKDPSTFRFDSTRFIGNIKKSAIDRGIQEYIPFEVQIRSAFEHAWMVTTHALSYKGKKVEWRRLRLASQIKAVVEQLDTLILSFDDSAGHISESYWPDIQAKKEIEEYFRTKIESRVISEILEPSSWSRFCDTCLSLLKSGNGSFRKPSKVLVADAFLVFDEYFSSNPAPISISLFQLAFGILLDKQIVKLPLHDFCPLITKEMEDIFPSIKSMTIRFDFEIS